MCAETATNVTQPRVSIAPIGEFLIDFEIIIISKTKGESVCPESLPFHQYSHCQVGSPHAY